ncbi:MAG: 1-(5-phosphoribosyl)-5-[(5-phosphoribosylamino)methylideneamino]imidazole-4-carboxamide isomerase [Kiritimatiellae bacterium]|nr:1-(5-phosphoribosyl)-5-[(5-phosphoribosylamino)methylideneamino]imidazole-4-carboxamide isomerase [Kiritimatiellia bacterium]MDW8458400.1 1-(5-phosphoribosyl)-5-[(5-phosphoribosylamino)methylideneamino]imidazole-4-carboxamide isomerase [Verrucomicrobiota bacterium]
MNVFIIYPAIDIRAGHCVRLMQGRSDHATVYSNDPVGMAKHWESEGAKALHVVDLDGAFEGRSVQHEIIARIIRAVTIPVQVGGGLRTDEDVARLLDAGASRVVIGTRAWAAPDEVRKLIERYGKKIAIGIDARGGLVQIKGWTETTNVRAVELARRADELGAQTIITTDTAVDGTLRGTNTLAVDEICMAVKARVIASGGISSVADVLSLKALGRANLVGAIVGKALYEGRVTVAALNKAASTR